MKRIFLKPLLGCASALSLGGVAQAQNQVYPASEAAQGTYPAPAVVSQQPIVVQQAPVIVAPPPTVSVPPTVVYVAPTYPSPGVGFVWEYHPRYGWGWHHLEHGWHRGWR